MASNFEIPGLGHLDSNNASSTPDPQAQNAAPEVQGAPKNDSIMSDADPTSQNNDKLTTVQGISSSSENTKPATGHGDAFEDEKMQDVGALKPTTSDQVQNTTIVASGTQDTEMNAPNDPQTEESAGVKPTLAEPRVTDALEAVLDGLLGPVPSDSALYNGNPTEQEKIPEEPVAEAQTQTEEVAPAAGKGDDNPEWEVDSSPYESSSSDNSDDSSDDESEVEESRLGVEETARLLMEADGGSDDEMDGTRTAKQAAGIRTKNEQPDVPEPRPDIRIDPKDSIVPLGIVQHIVEGTQAVIEALRDGSAVTVLDRGSVLCKEDRTVLGVIHDTIATVHKPMYVLRFKSEEEAKEAGLQKGMQVWYPKGHAVFVFPSQLRTEKGSDASNLHDEEVGPDEMEYSDDEEEQAHKREKKSRKRGKGKFNKGDEAGSRGPGPRREPNNLQYDEDDEGPYKPLQRPANFGMGLPPAPPPAVSNNYSPGNGSRGGHHNGWRGDGRGRGGGRGRGYNGRGRGGHGQHNSASQPRHNSHQPPPPFSANPPPMPGQWPFPIPPMPQFTGAPSPSNPSAPPNPAAYQAPNWGTAAQPPNPFPFPIIPPPGWPSAASQGPPASYMPQPPAGGYGAPPPQYPPGANGTSAAHPSTSTPNTYQQYPGYYNGGQAQNGQSQQHWG